MQDDAELLREGQDLTLVDAAYPGASVKVPEGIWLLGHSGETYAGLGHPRLASPPEDDETIVVLSRPAFQ